MVGAKNEDLEKVADILWAWALMVLCCPLTMAAAKQAMQMHRAQYMTSERRMLRSTVILLAARVMTHASQAARIKTQDQPAPACSDGARAMMLSRMQQRSQ